MGLRPADMRLCLLSVIAACMISGCAGGGGSAPGEVGTVSLSIHWPDQAGPAPAAMPAATESVKATVWQAGSVVAEATATRSGSSATLTMTEVPIGEALLRVDGFGHYPGTVIAHVEQPVTIVGGETTAVAVALAPTENSPPTADFLVNPITVRSGEPASFDASISADAETPLAGLQFRWDWENDGVWDTGWLSNPVTTHTFSAVAIYTVVLQVRDPAWVTGQTTHNVYVIVLPPPGP